MKKISLIVIQHTGTYPDFLVEEFNPTKIYVQWDNLEDLKFLGEIRYRKYKGKKYVDLDIAPSYNNLCDHSDENICIEAGRNEGDVEKMSHLFDTFRKRASEYFYKFLRSEK